MCAIQKSTCESAEKLFRKKSLSRASSRSPALVAAEIAELKVV
jgi:hypothetical protein